jgi:hypothetical protein
MALLGKTLKGRTTRPGGAEIKRNLKVRQISRTQEEIDENTKLSKVNIFNSFIMYLKIIVEKRSTQNQNKRRVKNS